MGRTEFMIQLEKLLGDISEGERQEAIDFYNSYFDDAGKENESKVIQELGSPGKVAAIIKADLAEDSGEYGEYTERGYEDSRMQDDKMPKVYEADNPKQDNGRSRTRNGYHAPAKKNNMGNLILIITICVLSIVIWGPILLGLLGTVVGVLISLVVAVFAIGIGGLAAFVCGIVFVVMGIVKCFTTPGLGLIVAAAGFGSFAIGILLILIFALCALKFLPWLIRKIASLGQKLLKKGRAKGGITV